MIHLLKRSQLRARRLRAHGRWTTGSSTIGLRTIAAGAAAPHHSRASSNLPAPKPRDPNCLAPHLVALHPTAASASPSRPLATIRRRRSDAARLFDRQKRRRYLPPAARESFSSRLRRRTPQPVSASSVRSFGATPPVRAPDRPRALGRPRTDLIAQHSRICPSRECAQVAAAPLPGAQCPGITPRTRYL